MAKVTVVKCTTYRGVRIEIVKWTEKDGKTRYGYCLPGGVLKSNWMSVIGQTSQRTALKAAKEYIDLTLYSRL